MKRFVDMRQSDIPGVRFAWWDTIMCRFEKHGGSFAWDTYDEFAADYSDGELDRYHALTPRWAFEPGEASYDLGPTDPSHGGKAWSE